jgi:hypothetical protein
LAADRSADFVVLAAVPARIIARRGLDQVGDGLPGLRAELEDGAELRAADAGVPDQGQQLDLLLQQRGLFGVVVEEERRRCKRMSAAAPRPSTSRSGTTARSGQQREADNRKSAGMD